MAIFLNEQSKIIVQGITGGEGTKHSTKMLAAGSNIVGGVNARKAGSTVSIGGKDLTVFGDGSQTRSFCFVSDLVAGILKLVFSNLNEPVNIGNPNEMTILQLAETIVEMTASKSTIDHRPLPA